MDDSLDEDDVRSRLIFDYQTVSLMNSPLMEVEAYRNLDDLSARRNPIFSGEEGHLATHYRVTYKIRTLIGPGQYSKSTTVRFDLFANNNYPLNEPACWVIDSPMPWSPHFLAGREICIGPIWKLAKGRIPLGELMVHVAKLLNFEEPPYEDPEYGGWQPDAVKYWETVLGRQPITKLVYPQIPRRLRRKEERLPSQVISFRKTSESSALPIKFRTQAPANDIPSLIKVRPE